MGASKMPYAYHCQFRRLPAYGGLGPTQDQIKDYPPPQHTPFRGALTFSKKFIASIYYVMFYSSCKRRFPFQAMVSHLKQWIKEFLRKHYRTRE